MTAPAHMIPALLAILALAPAPLAAQDEPGQETRTLLDEGLKAYLAGKNDEAFAKFQEVLTKNPSNDMVYAFYRRAGEGVVTGMINSADPRMRDTGKLILKLAAPGQAIRSDAAQIDKYLEDLKSDESAVFMLAFWHLKNIGPYAVTKLIPVLGQDTADKMRPRTMMLLTEMHYDAELALIEALESETLLMRQNAAILLGNIRSERALPYLKRILEDPNDKPEVKRYCHESMTKITARHEASWKSADEYFMELAEKYYYSHPTTVLRWQPRDLIWSFDKGAGAVVQRDVPAFAFNEQMCEEVLYDLLARNERHAGAWALLAANHAAQGLETQMTLKAAEAAVAAGEATAEDVDKLKALVAGHERAAALRNLVSRPYLYLALSRSLSDGRSEVAVELIEALGAMARPEDLPSAAHPADPARFGTPLVAALTHEAKSVRYAAARVMTRLNPPFRTVGMDLVMPVMSDALAERGIRTALLVHEARTPADREWINGMKKTLRKLGTEPTVSTSIPDAILQLNSFPREEIVFLQCDLAARVVFQAAINDKKVEEHFYKQIRDDVRTRDLPVVLICKNDEQKTQAEQMFGDAAGTVLAAGPVTDLEALITKLSAAQGDDAKNRADRLARAAAETLAALDTEHTMYPYLQVGPALAGAAGTEAARTVEIRLPATKALGRLGDPAALETLAAVIAAKGDPKELRLAAAESASAIFRASGAAPSEKTFGSLKEALNDGELEIEVAVAHALGNATLTLEQRRELETFKRIKRGGAGQ